MFELRPMDHSLNIKVMEEDVTMNDNIGDAEIDLIPFLNHPNQGFVKQMLEIKDKKGKRAGKLFIEL